MSSQRNGSDPSNTTSSSSESPTTRWWESYLVRYFAGFVIGALCICILTIDIDLFPKMANLILNLKGGAPANTYIKPDWTSAVFIFAFLGMVFCYVASAPITVMHAGRFEKDFLSNHSRHFWLAWILLITVGVLWGGETFINMDWDHTLIISLPALGLLFLISRQKEDSFALPSKKTLLTLLQSFLVAITIWSLANIIFKIFKVIEPEAIEFWMLGLPVFWIGITQYFVLFKILNHPEKFLSFYQDLFYARRRKEAKDVRESYTHLREHSNSVFIVVIEVSILCCLLALNRSPIFSASTPSKFVPAGQIMLVGLAIWLVPMIFMWSRANFMERSFSNNPDIFLNDEKRLCKKP